MKPICIPCQRFFRPKKNQFYFIEGMPADSETAPGNIEPERWKPYKIWAGDKWACEGCGAEIVVGVCQQPISGHYLPDFQQIVALTGANQFQVNDC